MFHITFNADVERRIKRLVELPRLNLPAKTFWGDLARMMNSVLQDAANIGEPKYDFKYVKMQSRLAVGQCIAIQCAVSEERSFVVVQKIALSGNHPYPPEFDEVLNPK